MGLIKHHALFKRLLKEHVVVEPHPRIKDLTYKTGIHYKVFLKLPAPELYRVAPKAIQKQFDILTEKHKDMIPLGQDTYVGIYKLKLTLARHPALIEQAERWGLISNKNAAEISNYFPLNYVDVVFRGQGIGGHIIDFIEEDLKDRFKIQMLYFTGVKETAGEAIAPVLLHKGYKRVSYRMYAKKM